MCRATGSANHYVLNDRHQLTEIDQGQTLTKLATFQYDALGRRIGKTIYSGSTSTTTNFVYDGINPIQEIQNGTFNNLLTGLGPDQRFARTDAPGRLYYLTDQVGSTIALTNASGTVVQQYAYDLYGGMSQLKSATVNNPYTFTGREDDGTGLYYYRARYYNPTLGRFTSEDPIGLAGGPNIYAYVQGNPLSLVDPYGLAARGGYIYRTPPPNRVCMKKILDEKYGETGAWLIEELSLFSLLPVDKNINGDPLANWKQTSVATGGKMATHEVLTVIEHSLAQLGATSLEVIGEFVATPASFASTLMNADAASEAQKECGCSSGK